MQKELPVTLYEHVVALAHGHSKATDAAAEPEPRLKARDKDLATESFITTTIFALHQTAATSTMKFHGVRCFIWRVANTSSLLCLIPLIGRSQAERHLTADYVTSTITPAMPSELIVFTTASAVSANLILVRQTALEAFLLCVQQLRSRSEIAFGETQTVTVSRIREKMGSRMSPFVCTKVPLWLEQR